MAAVVCTLLPASIYRSIYSINADEYYPILPPELWKIVIDLLIDEIRHPYRYCTPTTFPQYQVRFNLADKLEKDPTLEDWKNIRSVCWAWRELAGPQPTLYLRHFQQDALNEAAFKDISTILIHSQLEEDIILEALVQYPAICRNLTTLVFGENTYDLTLDILFDNSSSFPSLRCLSISNTVCNRRFWQAIQDEYPQLISLTLRQNLSDFAGTYALQNLEMLELQIWGDFQLSCPSLKHLAVNQGRTEKVVKFLMEHGDQLESLILGDSITFAVVAHSENVWAMVPNIRTLGRLAGVSFPVPPAGHPLQHLRLSAYRRSLDIDYVLMELELWPGITHIYIQPASLRSGHMKSLRALCLERSVHVVEISNEKPMSASALPLYARWLIHGLVILQFSSLLVSYPFRKLLRMQ
ncbi:hypothetical protein FRC16_000805 [Serendipita sp. 398]|nr:hypothetical protein FRC16_000805 [Serendipita sp. 398]